MCHALSLAALFFVMYFSNAAQAADHPLIAQLLAQEQAPPGVVFEIVTADPAGLQWAVPQVADYAKRLRERFPKLEIAVVSHGQEMFALQKDQRGAAPEVHAAIEQLVKQQHIPVHVCETYASWRGVGAEAFPAYVNVAPAGPTQVQHYMDLGYVRIKISAPIAGKAGP
jgi:intracellular sulfur oxidation DsrE/DsrF family protein